MLIQTSEQTFFNFLILNQSRFPAKRLYNIDYRRKKEKERMMYFVCVCGCVCGWVGVCKKERKIGKWVLLVSWRKCLAGLSEQMWRRHTDRTELVRERGVDIKWVYRWDRERDRMRVLMWQKSALWSVLPTVWLIIMIIKKEMERVNICMTERDSDRTLVRQRDRKSTHWWDTERYRLKE